jgi:hypothetical protein
MKVKLLKKLRKRFIWYYDTRYNAHNNWRVFDRVTEKEVVELPLAGYYFTERTILMMLLILNLQGQWHSRKEKRRKIRIIRDQQAIKQIFLDKEKSKYLA